MTSVRLRVVHEDYHVWMMLLDTQICCFVDIFLSMLMVWMCCSDKKNAIENLICPTEDHYLRRLSKKRNEAIGSCPSVCPQTTVNDRGVTYFKWMLDFEHESQDESENKQVVQQSRYHALNKGVTCLHTPSLCELSSCGSLFSIVYFGKITLHFLNLSFRSKPNKSKAICLV